MLHWIVYFYMLVWSNSSHTRVQAIPIDSYFLRIQLNSELWKCSRKCNPILVHTHTGWTKRGSAEGVNEGIGITFRNFKILCYPQNMKNYWISFSSKLSVVALNPNEWCCLEAIVRWVCVSHRNRTSVWNNDTLLEYTSHLTSFQCTHSVINIIWDTCVRLNLFCD